MSRIINIDITHNNPMSMRYESQCIVRMDIECTPAEAKVFYEMFVRREDPWRRREEEYQARMREEEYRMRYHYEPRGIPSYEGNLKVPKTPELNQPAAKPVPSGIPMLSDGKK